GCRPITTTKTELTMTFQDAIKTCFNKYANFEGTAVRSEYWWFFLFNILASAILSVMSEKLSLVFTLATLLPGIAVSVRRLHDTDRSGWWLLIGLVPFIGAIMLIVFMVQDSRPNRYLPSPATYA